MGDAQSDYDDIQARARETYQHYRDVAKGDWQPGVPIDYIMAEGGRGTYFVCHVVDPAVMSCGKCQREQPIGTKQCLGCGLPIHIIKDFRQIDRECEGRVRTLYESERRKREPGVSP